jgi:hypothetical protein
MFLNLMGIKQRIIDTGKQITFAKCLKMYSFLHLHLKFATSTLKFFWVKNNNMDIKKMQHFMLISNLLMQT